jgi:hypothetical protein
VLAGLISVGAAAAPGDPGAAPMSPVSGDAAVGAGLPTGGRLPAGHNRDAASGSGPVGGPSPSAPVPASFPKSGPATWRYAGGQGRVLGRSGPVQRFRVAIESNVSVDPVGFAAKIDRTLGDPRSWTASGQLRLQRVPAGSPSDFTIYLATERTSTRMCAAGGTDTGGYTSCRTAGHVIINLDRWYLSVPGYVDTHVPLDTYRTYVINHETGHQLGYGHELCPGSGRPAPVMQQQTLGLHGCVANPWPYLDGRRYAGPSGHY